MKVRIEQSALKEAVGWLFPIVNPNAYLPILSGIRVEAVDGFLRLQATDLELSGEIEVPAAIDEPGVVVASASMLHAVVSRLPDSLVSLADDGSGLTVEGGRVTAHVPILVAGDFPALPSVDDGATATITDSVLDLIAKRVAPIAGGESGHQSLQSVRFSIEDGQIVAGATDERRMHSVTASAKTSGEATALLPPRLLLSLAKSGDETHVVVGEERAEFAGSDRRIITTYIAGSWGHPREFLARNTSSPVSFDREELSTSLRRCLAVTSFGKNVPLRLHASDGALEMSAVAPSGARIHDSVPTDAEFTTAINPAYLLGALDALTAPRADLRVGVGQTPIVVEDGGAFRAVVMPMAIKE